MFTFTRSGKTLLSLARDSWKFRRLDQFSTLNNRPGNAFWKEKMVKIRKTLSEEFKKSSPFPTIALIAFDFAVVYGVFHVITQYGVNYTICVGPSMIPTLNEKGDFVLIDVFSYRMLNKDYRVGDVVICVCPYDPDKTVCKRIAAVSGDIVFVSRTRSVNNSYVNPFSNVPNINGDLEKVRVTDASGPGTVIRTAASAARNHTSHSDSAMENVSSSGSRINSRIHRFLGSSSSDASPHPNDEQSTPSVSRPPSLVVVVGDDSEEKRMYPRDNSGGGGHGSGSGSVVPIKKAQENRSDKIEDHGVVSEKMNGGFDGGQGSRPRIHPQDPSKHAALVVSTVPSSHTLVSEEEAIIASTRIPSTPSPSPSAPSSSTAPTAPSSSFVTQYSEPVIIPPGHVWLAGDNVNNSTDSRFYGPVPTGLLRGRVFTKLRWGLWPFEVINSSTSSVVTTSSSPDSSGSSKG